MWKVQELPAATRGSLQILRAGGKPFNYTVVDAALWGWPTFCKVDGMSLKSFRDLEVWQVAMQLVTEVYPLTMSFAHPHRFEIGGQMRDAVTSAPSNIAEGYTQRSRKVYLR